MTGGSHIRAVGPEDAQNAQETIAVDAEPMALEEEWQEPEPEEEAWVESGYFEDRKDFSWILPTLAIALILAWTGLYAWTLRGELQSGASLEQWTQWISTWSLPTLLIATAWLVAMRHSTREAARFSDAASQLRRETADLETRMNGVNRELSMAREFLGAQSRELESLGRVASKRLSSHAETLQSLIQTNGDQVKSIAEVSNTALANMAKLRDDLPVVANSARDVTSQIGNAGQTADEQLQQLITGFERLNDFGKASEAQVGGLTASVGNALSGFESQLEALAAQSENRFSAIRETNEGFEQDLQKHEETALAALKQRSEKTRGEMDGLLSGFASEEEKSLIALQGRIDTIRKQKVGVSEEVAKAEQEAIDSFKTSSQRLMDDIAALAERIYTMDEKSAQSAKDRIESLYREATRFDDILAARDGKFQSEMDERQAAFDKREEDAAQAMSARLGQFDAELEERAKDHLAHAQNMADQSAQITEKLFEFSGLIESANALFASSRKEFAKGLEGLSEKITSNENQLSGTKAKIEDLTQDGVRLLEILQSSSSQSSTELPASIEAAEESLKSVEERALQLKSSIEESSKMGSDLSNYVTVSKDSVSEIDQSLAQLGEKLEEQKEANLAKLKEQLEAVEQLGKESDAVASRAQETLGAAIAQLNDETKQAFVSLETGLEQNLESSAGNLSAKAITAIEATIQSQSEDAIGRMEAAASKAALLGRETAIQLRDQLSKVNELTGNLEKRVGRAREQAEEQIDNDFSRRMALITDSLNSNAIDIAKAMSTDVTDTQWNAYLKGDRGIFTRQAVKLIDKTEAKELTDLYQHNSDFREHVNRFIHDFETMLRSVLSTRDGNALGVTVLGSDMGKLYVALAQAIDRLRN
jgi:chromosome segregation ATPase